MIDVNVSVFSIYLICVVENCWFHTLMWTWMKEFLFHANDDYEYELVDCTDGVIITMTFSFSLCRFGHESLALNRLLSLNCFVCVCASFILCLIYSDLYIHLCLFVCLLCQLTKGVRHRSSLSPDHHLRVRVAVTIFSTTIHLETTFRTFQ